MGSVCDHSLASSIPDWLHGFKNIPFPAGSVLRESCELLQAIHPLRFRGVKSELARFNRVWRIEPEGDRKASPGWQPGVKDPFPG